jgi:hypothetical protein
MGRMMDLYLNMQRNMNEAMGRWFSAMNLPTRTDVLSLANRLADIEDRLGGIEQGLSKLAPKAASAPKPATAAARPARTRKPPAKA